MRQINCGQVQIFVEGGRDGGRTYLGIRGGPVVVDAQLAADKLDDLIAVLIDAKVQSEGLLGRHCKGCGRNLGKGPGPFCGLCKDSRSGGWGYGVKK